MNWQKSVVLFFILIFQSFALGQSKVKVNALVDRNEMYESDTFTLTIEVSSENSLDVGEPRLNGLKNFDLLNSWVSNESYSTYTNGKFVSNIKKKFNYMLAPKKKGALTLPAFEVQAGNTTYNTQPIRLKILAGDGGGSRKQKVAPNKRKRRQPSPFGFDPDDEEDIFSQLLKQRSDLFKGFRTEPANPKHAFFIQVEVDKTTAYVGEQVTASWYLYTRNHISDIDTLKHPTLKGFWKEDIEMVTRLNFTNEIVNGVAYKKALLASFALFPINPGDVFVDEYKAKCTVLISNGFGFGKPYSYTKSSDKVKINVLPLPESDKPTLFSGAVGFFNLTAQVENTQTPANQPILLKVRFEGRGNAKLIDLPQLNLPPSLELYDTKKESKFYKNGTSYTEFEVLVIPREEGEQTIPSLSVSLFDPIKKQYYTKTTEPIALEITPALDNNEIESSPLAKGSQKTNDDKKSNPLVLSFKEPSFQFSYESKMSFWAILYLFLFLFMGWRVKVEYWGDSSKQSVSVNVQKRLSHIQNLLQSEQWREVGIEVTNTIYFVMGAVSHQGGANIPFDQLLKKAPPSIRHEMGEELRQILSLFETIGFAPEELVGVYKDQKVLKKEFSKAEKVILKAVKLSAPDRNEA